MTDLINVIRDGEADDVNATYAALVERHGQDEADRLWNQACSEVDHDAAVDAALADLTSALAEAGLALRRAAEAVGDLSDGSAWYVECAEGQPGTDIAAFVADAQRAVRAAQAIHEATGGGS